MAKIRWTRRARKDLEEIEDYIAQDSVTHACRFTDRLVNATRRLARFPLSGAMVAEYERDDLREIYVGNYRIIYMPHGDEVIVVAVVHGARDLPGVFETNPVDEE